MPTSHDDPEHEPAAAPRIFLNAAAGDGQAIGEAVSEVYEELRRLAGAEARRSGQEVFQPTALVHETYLRLRKQRTGGWTDRGSFLAVASRVMRNVLVDRARERRCLRRGGDRERADLQDLRMGVEDEVHGVLEVNDLLDQLAAVAPEQARVAELFVFGGLTLEAVAKALEVSPRTIDRRWRFARAWLFDRLREPDPERREHHGH